MSIDLLKAQAKIYVTQQADKIVADMIKRQETEYSVATCDHRLWDKKLHSNFPKIAQLLRERGFNVSSRVNHGVTDWSITVA
jgi:hypothetical protein